VSTAPRVADLVSRQEVLDEQQVVLRAAHDREHVGHARDLLALLLQEPVQASDGPDGYGSCPVSEYGLRGDALAAGAVQQVTMAFNRAALAVLVVVGVALGGGAGELSAAAGGAPSGRASLLPIQDAKRARAVFRIFPSDPGTISCRIPRGGPAPGGTIAGRCSTALAGTPGHGGASIVTFTERWGHGWRLHHTWRVRVTATNKIVWIRESGNQAPQTWR
jgi:hypothetical protein